MIDYHIHPHQEIVDPIDHRSTISNQWQVDSWGFVTTDFAVECMFRHGVKQFMDVNSIKRPFPCICRFPQEVVLDESESD